MPTRLDSKRVTEMLHDCLFKEGEDTSSHVKAEGIMHTMGFHPERLESYRREVEGMLYDLPEAFMESGGGGWSFLNACIDKEKRQWTDLQPVVEELLLLGLGLNKVKFILPREVWSALPGGVPYFIVLDGKKEDQ